MCRMHGENKEKNTVFKINIFIPHIQHYHLHNFIENMQQSVNLLIAQNLSILVFGRHYMLDLIFYCLRLYNKASAYSFYYKYDP